MSYLIVLSRTLIFYIIIVVIYRLMGKREIGELSIIDFIVSILIAEFTAISIENWNESLMYSLLPILFLTTIQITLAYISLKSTKIRHAIDGKPSVIINKGRVNFKEMVTQRYNLEDLLTGLREKNIRTIDEVDYAILESTGNLSVFKKNDKRKGEYPLAIILDGNIEEETLKAINKTKKWLNNTLSDKKIKLENVFYAFYTKENLYIISK